MGAPAVASYLGVTLRTVYAIIDEGQLPAFKIRRVIRVRREDVDQYLERCRIKPGELRHLYPATSEGRRPVPRALSDQARRAAPPVGL